MFSRLKQAISKTAEEDSQVQRKKSIDVSFLNPKQIEEYKVTLQQAKTNIEDILEISKVNKEELFQFIKQQKQMKTEKQQQKKTSQQQEEVFTIEEDMEEVKTLLQDAIKFMTKLQQTNEEIKDKIRNVSGEVSSDKVRQMQQIIKKYQNQIKSLHTSEDNNKQILTTLRQQTQLLSKETKELQQKNIRIQKELAQKTMLVNNLQEEKIVLLEMRNVETHGTNPEVQRLTAQITQIDKKFVIQRTKVQQKEKQIDTLKKKMEEDRDSLQKIADQLKEKELKSKKILDKYERSKTEIRKYRQQKTEFIKKLNMEIASLTDKVQKLEGGNAQLQIKCKQSLQKNEHFQSQISKIQGKSMELESARSQLKQLRQQQIQTSSKFQLQENEISKLKGTVDQLQSKRKALLQALQKPINHEIKTLDKIIRALQRLYKEYIEIVFEQGNIIGFQTKISYILSNVCEIKEDLKL